MRRLAHIIPFVLCTLIFLSGCENTFTPFSDSGDRAIVVTGFLDHNADSQFVRVQVVRRTINSTASLDDGISAVLENVGAGTSTTLADSIVTTENGDLAHLFFTSSPIAAGTRYRLVASSDDGEQTIRRTTVPVRGGFSLDSVGTSQLSISQTVHLGLSEIPNDLSVIYTVQVVGNPSPTRIELPYDNSAIRTETSIDLTVRLQTDRTLILDMLGLPSDDGTTALLGVAVEYVRFSPEWDAALLPRDDLNFFGSKASFNHSWHLSNQVLDDLGWAVP